MKPSDIYARAPVEVSRNVDSLIGFYYDHIPEAQCPLGFRDLAQQRVEIRYYRNHSFDGRRVWILASVWFDDAPVMVIQNAGREGDDHHAKFVTDLARYREMIGYLRHCIVDHEMQRHEEWPEAVAADSDQPLDSFYGNSLDGHFGHH